MYDYRYLDEVKIIKGFYEGCFGILEEYYEEDFTYDIRITKLYGVEMLHDKLLCRIPRTYFLRVKEK